MVDKLEAIKTRFDEVSEAILDPNIMSDMKRYASLNKEYKELNKIVEVYAQYKNILDNIESSKKVLSVEKDPDFREMAKEELEILAIQKDDIELVIKELLIPKDPNDSKTLSLKSAAVPAVTKLLFSPAISSVCISVTAIVWAGKWN